MVSFYMIRDIKTVNYYKKFLVTGFEVLVDIGWHDMRPLRVCYGIVAAGYNPADAGEAGIH
jgi:hypothetical protein